MKALYIYRLFNLLSLDVAAGAICMAWFACHIFQIAPPSIYFLLLGQGIWAIYLTDHLYDTRKPEAYSYRRRFYKKYFKLLGILYLLNIITAGIIFVVYFSAHLLLSALPAFFISALYLFFNWFSQERKKPFYAKELLISLGYVAGIMAVPMSVVPRFNFLFFAVAMLFFLVAYWNVLVIARYEQEQNVAEGQTSMGQWMSLKNIQRLIFFVFFIFLVGLIFTNLLWISSWHIYLLWAIMAGYMVIPMVFIKFIGTHERYRVFVDRVFLLPGFLFVFERIVSYL